MPTAPSPAVSRRSFLRMLAAAGVATGAGSLLSACGDGSGGAAREAASSSDGGGGDGPLRIGYLPITDATPLLVAHGRGYYADEGVEAAEPTLFRGWSAIAEAFLARQVDAIHLLMPMAVNLRFDQDFPAKLVAWNHTDGSALTVANEVTQLSDLAGRTVAVPFWYSIHNVALQMLFAKEGLTPILQGEPDADAGEVALVVMAPPDMPPALDQGSIGGYIVADPFNAAAEVNEIGHVLRFTGDVWQRHACCVVLMHEDDLADRPDWSQGVVTALARAQLDARDDPMSVAELLSDEGEGYLPQPLPILERALSEYDDPAYGEIGAIQHPEWDSRRIDFQPFPFPSYTTELVRRMGETLVEGDTSFLDDLDPEAAHDELVDDTLARAAIDELGGPEAFGLPDDLTREERIDA
jgi:NitT/TauT family transport system substrate-binding protein